METVRRLRAMALLCRQTAAYHPDRSWKLLAEAEYWEHLANEALERSHKCTPSDSVPQPIAKPNSTRSTTAVAA
jgi:hypothetical protein